jgi:hypothetical protein
MYMAHQIMLSYNAEYAKQEDPKPTDLTMFFFLFKISFLICRNIFFLFSVYFDFFFLFLDSLYMLNEHIH